MITTPAACLEGALHPPLVLVDGSNVAFAGRGKPRLQNITAVLEELKRGGAKTVTLVDAGLRHRIDDRQGLEELVKSGEIHQVPAGRQADEFLVQLGLRARGKGELVFILTNDRLQDWEGGRDFPRIAYLLVPMDGSDVVILSPPPEGAGRIGEGQHA